MKSQASELSKYEFLKNVPSCLVFAQKLLYCQEIIQKKSFFFIESYIYSYVKQT